MEIPQEVLSVMKKAKKIAVLTGAGISAESGLITFRGKDGIWEKFDPDEVATPGAWKKDPLKVWEFHEEFRKAIAEHEPNPAHFTLAEIEKSSDDFTLITQNIDQYHQDAGSKNVIELHGNVWRVKCLKEGTVSVNKDVPMKQLPPYCSCGSMLRPDVVWFNEPLPPAALENAFKATYECDLMIVVGTSIVIYPAAMLPSFAYEHGAKIIEFNLEPTPISHLAMFSFFGKAGETLPEVWEKAR
ncbi:MAG: NAD-dependent deacylase [Thermoplasmata archaeon]|nr:MAG: NAD-dependent deacylase [Thermoplasmata archaeon]